MHPCDSDLFSHQVRTPTQVDRVETEVSDTTIDYGNSRDGTGSRGQKKEKGRRGWR